MRYFIKLLNIKYSCKRYQVLTNVTGSRIFKIPHLTNVLSHIGIISVSFFLGPITKDEYYI